MSRITHSAARVACVSLILSALACRTYHQLPYPGDVAAGSAIDPGPYLISPGDRLRITVPYHSTWNTDANVRPDCRITVAFLGEVVAANRTIGDLDAELEKGLAAHLKDPAVQIDVSEYAERAVYIGGEVHNPGTVSFKGDRIELVEAIVKAGGFLKESADLSTVIIARENAEGCRSTWKVNLSGLMTARCPPQPIRLRNHDVVLVPNTPVDQANIFIDKYITRMIPGGPQLLTSLFFFAAATP